MGLIDEAWPLTERDPKVPAWDAAENRDWQGRRMAVYAAQIDRMDRGIGRIVGALEQTGLLENTLILFLSDNGGAQEVFGWVDWRDYPESEGATPPAPGAVQTSLWPKVTRDGEPIQLGNMPEYMPGPEDTYQSYGRPWANVSNTPFREYKHLVHEGGIATPLIAHWPAGIERQGELVRQPGHVVDLMATAVDLGAAPYPDTVAGRAIRSRQGVSRAGVPRTGPPSGRSALFRAPGQPRDPRREVEGRGERPAGPRGTLLGALLGVRLMGAVQHGGGPNGDEQSCGDLPRAAKDNGAGLGVDGPPHRRDALVLRWGVRKGGTRRAVGPGGPFPEDPSCNFNTVEQRLSDSGPEPGLRTCFVALLSLRA